MISTTPYPDTVLVPASGRYTIDPAVSTIRFATRHLFGLAPVRGSFAVLAGTADLEQAPGSCRLRVEIDAASFTTGNQRRDATVRGPRFLDSSRFPTFTFCADRLESTEDHWMLPGELTVRDATRPVTVAVTRSGVTESPAGGPASLVIAATARVDRRAFGVTASPGMAGRFLDLRLQIAFRRS